MLDDVNLNEDQMELVKSLQNLGIQEEEIAKSLNIELKGSEIVEKSIDEQIAEKKAEIDMLEKSRSESTLPINIDIEEKINTLGEKFGKQLEGLTDIVKSLANSLVELKESNESLKIENSELKKSHSASVEIINKIANHSAGLKSVNGVGFVERFEKSNNGGSLKEVSISQNKDEISSMLAKKMDDVNFMKSMGDEVAKFEISGIASPILEKAIKDEFGIQLTK